MKESTKEFLSVKDVADMVEAEKNLTGDGIDLEKGVMHISNSIGGKFSLAAEDIEAIPAEELWAVRAMLLGDREPQVVWNVSRVCGYYSRVDNWNNSKKGELKDRRKGNYKIT